jgi:RNA polymerase sigma-70 factor (ECF subfamily)
MQSNTQGEFATSVSGIEVEPLYRRYHRQAYGLAWTLLKNEEDAHDAVQEAFVKVLRNSARFEARASHYSWLYRIVTNVCLDKIRKRRGKQEIGIDPVSESQQPAPKSSAYEPSLAYDAGVLRSALDESIAELSEEHRAVIVMRELEGLTYDEMADTCACPRGTIMSRLFHARRKLRRVLSERLELEAVPA